MYRLNNFVWVEKLITNILLFYSVSMQSNTLVVKTNFLYMLTKVYLFAELIKQHLISKLYLYRNSIYNWIFYNL